MTVNPQGATPAYAAPELLRSLQLQCEEGGVADPGLLVNGPSADWWAVGIVLFELLTGELPFRGKAAPECLDSHCKKQWEDYEDMLQAHQSWVSMPCSLLSSTTHLPDALRISNDWLCLICRQQATTATSVFVYVKSRVQPCCV